MSTKDKLIERFKSQPSDFTFDELVTVFKMYGFEVDNKGRTSGSRVRFKRGNAFFACHKPHPQKIVSKGTLRDAYCFLMLKGLL